MRCDFKEQFGCLLDGQKFEVFGLEKSKKRTFATRESVHQPLGGGNNAENGVFLNHCPQGFLSLRAKRLEYRVEVFDQNQEGSSREGFFEKVLEKVKRVIRLKFIGGFELFGVVAIRIALA